VDPENAFLRCEGKRGNIFEVMGSVGLQTISGKRIAPNNASNRPLASIFPGDTRPENLGMVLGNFTRGLEPAESAFLSWAARIGPVVTKTQTSEIGDIGNRMTNAFQGIVIKDGAPQELTRKTMNIIQTSYAYDNLDPKYMLVRKMDRQYDPELPRRLVTPSSPPKESRPCWTLPLSNSASPRRM
jgi:DNA-directed RNA polymerase beta' subunit